MPYEKVDDKTVKETREVFIDISALKQERGTCQNQINGFQADIDRYNARIAEIDVILADAEAVGVTGTDV